jgi:hypothetical protein
MILETLYEDLGKSQTCSTLLHNVTVSVQRKNLELVKVLPTSVITVHTFTVASLLETYWMFNFDPETRGQSVYLRAKLSPIPKIFAYNSRGSVYC